MRERPILCSDQMVRALLDRSKTQARRIVKPQPVIQRGWVGGAYWERRPERSMQPADRWCIRDMVQFSPYGQPGDRLWVRETFYCDNAFYPDGVGVDSMWRVVDGQRVAVPIEEQRAEMGDEDMYYRADGEPDFEGAEGKTPWRPSIHMPRWASRITLEVTGVRVERLQDISETDAEAEGIDFLRHAPDADETLTPRQLYMCLWDGLKPAAGAAWADNPWVWVVEFRRVTDSDIRAAREAIEQGVKP